MAKASEKITKKVVDAALPGDKLYRIWDGELKGFGVKVMPSGVKTYIIVYRPNGGGRASPVKEFTIGRHGALTPEEARKEASLRLGDVERGDDPQENRAKARAEMTIAQLCDQYMREGTGTKKASTLRSDQSRIACHIKPLLGTMRVSAVTGADIERFMRDVAKGKTAVAAKPSRSKPEGKALLKGETRTRKDSPARGGKGTASRTVGFLGGIFSYAMKLKMRTDNPVHGVSRYKDRKSQRFLNADELGRLGAALEGLEGQEQAVGVIRLLTLTGARKGEIEALRWAEVDGDTFCLRLGDSKTGQKVVPLGTAALALLKNIKPDTSSPFVFPARARDKAEGPSRHFVGTPKAWASLTKAAGLDGVRLHDLRHTFASLGVSGGHSLPMIGKILGHADVKTTAQYAHLADDPLKKAVNRISHAAASALAGKADAVVPLKAGKKAQGRKNSDKAEP